jgi:hypothetical protein
MTASAFAGGNTVSVCYDDFFPSENLRMISSIVNLDKTVAIKREIVKLCHIGAGDRATKVRMLFIPDTVRCQRRANRILKLIRTVWRDLAIAT